jgi:putative transposase
MLQSLSKMWSHLIFSTKERYPFLSDKTIRPELQAYMAATLRRRKSGESQDSFRRWLKV